MTKRTDYSALDAALLSRIKGGIVSFTAIQSGEVRDIAEELARAHPNYKTRYPTPGWRFIDRRLQVLRKAGLIRYQRKPEGWVLCEKGGAA